MAKKLKLFHVWKVFLIRRLSRSFSSNEGTTDQKKNIIQHSSHSRRNVLMYEALFSGGWYIGVNEESKYYCGVVASMINGLKGTVPITIRFSPEKKNNERAVVSSRVCHMYLSAY